MGGLITDSRGQQSRTLVFVTVSWAVLVVKFALAGLVIPVLGSVPAMTAAEFGSAMAMILAIWLGREWQARRQS